MTDGPSTAPFCRSCGAEITWATMHPSGKAVPLDRVTVADGNVIQLEDSNPDRLMVRVLGDLEKHGLDQEPGGGMAKRWVVHFTTCPNAKQHRLGGPR